MMRHSTRCFIKTRNRLAVTLRHIAAIRLSALGDVAMTVPILHALSQQYPELRVTMVSRPFFKPLFDGLENTTFLAADLAGKHKKLPGLLQLSHDLKDRGVDGFADLHNVLRSHVISLLLRLSGITVATLDKARSQRSALTRPHNKKFSPLTPVTHRYAKVFADLGYALDLSALSAVPKLEPGIEMQAVSGVKNSKWLGIAPFAKHAAKVYPHDLMQQVIDGLATDDLKIFLFGAGADEGRQLEQFASGRKNITIVAGKLSFAKELELISNLDAMLSMDSGNAHIAAMYGVPTVTLWGATHPFAGFAPFNQPLSNALTSDREKFPMLPTSIYGNKKVKGYEDAMRTILPQSVIEKIREILS